MEAYLKTGKLGKSAPSTSKGKGGDSEAKDDKKRKYPVPWVEK
jgi:hypothetical protein